MKRIIFHKLKRIFSLRGFNPQLKKFADMIERKMPKKLFEILKLKTLKLTKPKKAISFDEVSKFLKTGKRKRKVRKTTPINHKFIRYLKHEVK